MTHTRRAQWLQPILTIAAREAFIFGRVTAHCCSAVLGTMILRTDTVVKPIPCGNFAGKKGMMIDPLMSSTTNNNHRRFTFHLQFQSLPAHVNYHWPSISRIIKPWSFINNHDDNHQPWSAHHWPLSLMIHHITSLPGKTTAALGTERWQFRGTNLWEGDKMMGNTSANDACWSWSMVVDNSELNVQGWLMIQWSWNDGWVVADQNVYWWPW